MMEHLSFKKFDSELHENLLEQLTSILHSAYKPLAEKGMRYLASHQPTSKTLERLCEGESYLIFLKDELIGTVTLYTEKLDSTCEYYRKQGVYSFGQFAVVPSLQGKGIGSRAMDFVENRAKEIGAKELALDTSEHAEHLIKMYQKRGYKIVDHTQWDVTNYLSVIMSKDLNKKEEVFLFRPAKPEEMDTIFMMGFDVWSEGTTAQQYLKECQSSEKYKRGKWFVLENSKNQPVCSLITYSFDNEKIGIGSIATQPDFRGKGLASLLVKKFLDSASSKQMIFLYSDISPKLYERLGFRALPKQLQQYQTSTCLVWGNGLNIIESRTDFQPPKYF